MQKETRGFEILDGMPPDVLAISAHGRVTRDDYETVLIPRFEEMLAREGKVKLLFIFGDDFSTYSPGAAWDDAKFGLLHLRDIASLAIVTDLAWLRTGVKALAPFIGCPVAVFQLDEIDSARRWVREWKHPSGGGPRTAADRMPPPLEDKM